jgi:hypothetical protein
MKNLFFSFFVLLFPLMLTAQQIDQGTRTIIDEFIKSKLISEKAVIGPEGVSKVFTGNFYKVQGGFIYLDGSSLCSEFYCNVNGTVLTQFEGLSEDKELPVLFSLLKKDFLIKDEAGAKLFEAALNELYPVKEDEKAGLRHMKKGNQWIFIRGKFFDDYTAVIITASTAGNVSKIEVKLAYAVN